MKDTADGGLGAPMHPTLAALVAGGLPSPDRIDAALVDLRTPLAEPGALTFLWRGEATSVELLRWINAGVDALPLERLPGTDLWHLRVPAEDRGRFEYKLKVTGDHGENWDLDPMNPERAADPFGENSVALTWGYERPAWTHPRGAPPGTLTEITVDSAVFGHARTERIYLPANYDADAPYPVVVIHDGADYDGFAALTVSLDNLIDAGDVPPLIALLIQAGDRMDEYPRGRRHARYVVQELLPALEARHKVSERPRDRVLMGASLGAVASLATAFRFPGAFGGLILKSGSFILDRRKLRHRAHPVFERTARLIEAVDRAPDLPGLRAFVSTGELEGLADQNRALAHALRARGMEVKFHSVWDGHHWHAWRDQLRDALMWVLRDD